MHCEPILVTSLTDSADFQRDVLSGLAATQKSIPAKYLYDKIGSELFDQICELDEYYPTRTELGIMKRHAGDMARTIGPHPVLVELGSGSSLKTRLLLEAMNEPRAYVPIDISSSALEEAARLLRIEFPELNILPVCGDFSDGLLLPENLEIQDEPLAGYFPGSTIGNLTPPMAIDLMSKISECPDLTGFLVGIDLDKDVTVLEKAYNDHEGVTAEFNLNLLDRINRELDGNFRRERFRHQAIYHPVHHRMEMHLISEEAQQVEVCGQTFRFRPGESICTEHSHKYTLERFEALAHEAGFGLEQSWTDENNWFAVVWLVPA